MQTKLATRTARAKLAPRHRPYFHTLRPGLHIAYRKGKRGGMWLGRTYLDGRYIVEYLVPADDDLSTPDAVDYATAVTKVLAWSQRKIEEARKAARQAKE